MKNVQKKFTSTTLNNFHKYGNNKLFEDLKQHGCNVKKVMMLEEVIDYLYFHDHDQMINIRSLKYN